MPFLCNGVLLDNFNLPRVIQVVFQKYRNFILVFQSPFLTLKNRNWIFPTAWQKPVVKNQQQVFKDCLQYFWFKSNRSNVP